MKSWYLPVLCPAVYVLTRAVASPGFWRDYLSDYTLHSILFFTSFLVLPVALIRTAEGIYSGKIQLVKGVAAYLIIIPVFLVLFDHALGPKDAVSLVLVAINVVAVDFYVFRVWQYPFVESGWLKASLVGIAVWIAVHIPESHVLLTCGFSIQQVFGFMIFSGTLLSTVYSRIKDVAGFMVGHVILNVAVAVT